MQVFISWSGARSKAVAATLADWLSQVIQAVDPWISSDIDKGARWSPEISTRLESSKVGVVCLTRENLDSRWILFESGALSKTKDAYVCTLLLDVLPTDVEQPLGQFQHTTREEKDILQLVRTINKTVETCGERALSDTRLDEVFDTYWPKLRDSLDAIAKQEHAKKRSAQRTERELLEELLELSRANESRLANLTRAREREPLNADLLTKSLAPRKEKDQIKIFLSSQDVEKSLDPDTLRYWINEIYKLLELRGKSSSGTKPDEPPKGDA
jgi:hypothetical protein